MAEQKVATQQETLPISPSLKIIDFRTVNKGLRWWSAAVVIEAYGRKSICLYLWQKRKGEWKRKQKFSIQTRNKWTLLDKAINELLPNLEN